MKIGIIGAGNIGSALATRFCAVGHDVMIANSRGPQSLGDVAARTGATAASVVEAARGRDVVIVTIPQAKILDLPSDLFAHEAASAIVVDTGNYYPRQRDGKLADLEAAPSESSWVASKLGRPVIKVFNNIYAQHLLENGKPHGAPGRIALPVAGDEPDAKATVMKLVDAIGFDPIDAGTLAQSWRQQPGSPVYAGDLDAAGVREALAAASPERTAEWTGTEHSPGSFEDPR